MYRLYRHIIILFIAFVVTVIATRLLSGGSQPLASFAATFLTNPDGTFCQWPCLFGVQSEVTPYLAGVEIMKAHPFSRYIASPIIANGLDWEGKNFTFVLGNYTGNVQRSPLVTSIYLSFDAKSGMKNATTPSLTITADQVISFMGKPAAIWQNGSIAALYYPANRMVIGVSLLTRDIYHIDATDPDPVVEITIPSKRSYTLPPGAITP